MENAFYNSERIKALEKAFEGYVPVKTESEEALSLTAKNGGNELRAEISAVAVLGFKGLASSAEEGFYFGIYHPTEEEFSRLLSDISDIISGKACAVNIKSEARHDIMKLLRIDCPAEEEASRLAANINGPAEVRFNYWDSGKNNAFTF